MSVSTLKFASLHSSLTLCLVVICLINISSSTSLFTNDIFDDITDSVTVRVRARSPKTSKPSGFIATDTPTLEVTGPIDTFVASTIRSNTRAVTPSVASTTTTTTTTTTTVAPSSTTAAPTTPSTTTTTTTKAATKASPTTTTESPKTTSRSKPLLRVPASTTTSTTTKATPVRRLATHPPWPGETTTKARATHPPWNPEELHRPRGSSKQSSGSGNRNRATHAPWSTGGMNHYGDTSGGGFGYSSSQSEHLFPTKSNYAPYVYGSDAKKKTILPILDRESINSWAKDMISFIAHPFSSASAVGTSSSSESSESLIGRVFKTLRAVLNKRSGEERNGGVDELANDNILFKLKNASWIKRLQGTSSSSSNHNSHNKNDKRFRDVALTTLVDFLRFKRHRTQASDASTLKAGVKDLSSPCTTNASNQCHT